MDVIHSIQQNPNTIWEIVLRLDAEQLERVIAAAADAYYNSEAPILTDAQYDILVERLREINAKSHILTATGAKVKGAKTKLPYWMGSMNKIKSDTRLLQRWCARFRGPYLISDKLDGVSCLVVKSERKIKLYTRGDGTFGQDISHLVRDIQGLPSSASKTSSYAVRGELIMSRKKFRKYAETMSNARNMVSGIVNSKPQSLDHTAAADVDLIAYEIVDPQFKPSRQFQKLEEWGFQTVYHETHAELSIDVLDEILEQRKSASKYEIDGIIVSDDHNHTRNTDGNPDYAFAYKGMTPSAQVKVEKIIWTPSKDGVLVPRIKFQPVRLSQVNIQYTQGFNAKFVVDNGIDRNAVITIIRSGDVIPHIINVVRPVKTKLPTQYDFHWDKNEVNIVLDAPENNSTVIIKRIAKFVKDIGVENISEGNVAKLYHAGYNTIMKIIRVSVQDIAEIPGFGRVMARKLHASIKSAISELDILKLAVASNIFGRGFGERKLRRILNAFPRIFDEYRVDKKKVWQSKIALLENFNKITTDQFLLHITEFIKFYQRLQNNDIPIRPYQPIRNARGLFQNEVVVFTGFRNVAWKTYIEAQGGRVSESVSRNTTLVVYVAGQTTNAKYVRAQQLGIRTMTQDEFQAEYM